MKMAKNMHEHAARRTKPSCHPRRSSLATPAPWGSGLGNSARCQTPSATACHPCPATAPAWHLHPTTKLLVEELEGVVKPQNSPGTTEQWRKMSQHSQPTSTGFIHYIIYVFAYRHIQIYTIYRSIDTGRKFRPARKHSLGNLN